MTKIDPIYIRQLHVCQADVLSDTKLNYRIVWIERAPRGNPPPPPSFILIIKSETINQDGDGKISD